MSQLGLRHHMAHDLLSSPFLSTTAANAGPRCRPSIINTHSYCCHTPLSRAELSGEGTRWRLIKVPPFCYCLALEESIIMKNRTTVKGGWEREEEEGTRLGSVSGTDAAKMAIVLGQNNKGCMFRQQPI